MKRILLLGKGGQLGWEARRCLTGLGDVIALDYPEINFGDLKRLGELLHDIKPAIIYNAAAYTAVDRAEKEAELAGLVNAKAPAVMAEYALKHKALLVHFSTDYVFNGEKAVPYLESDSPDPLNVYGQSKWEGEKNIQKIGGAYLIFRTAWVYSQKPESFVGKVLSWARRQTQIKIVSDQIGSPTWARLLAEASALVLAQGGADVFDWGKGVAGLYHTAGVGSVSRLDWAKRILELDPKREEQICKEVLPANTADFPTPAKRPLATALDCSKFSKTFGVTLGDWKDGLALAME